MDLAPVVLGERRVTMAVSRACRRWYSYQSDGKSDFNLDAPVNVLVSFVCCLLRLEQCVGSVRKALVALPATTHFFSAITGDYPVISLLHRALALNERPFPA